MLEATDDGDGGHFGQQFEQHDVRVVVGGTWWDRGEESVHRGGQKSERRGAHHFDGRLDLQKRFLLIYKLGFG